MLGFVSMPAQWLSFWDDTWEPHEVESLCQASERIQTIVRTAWITTPRPAQWSGYWDNSSRDALPGSTEAFQRLPSGLDSGTSESAVGRPAISNKKWDAGAGPANGMVLKAGTR